MERPDVSSLVGARRKDSLQLTGVARIFWSLLSSRSTESAIQAAQYRLPPCTTCGSQKSARPVAQQMRLNVRCATDNSGDGVTQGAFVFYRYQLTQLSVIQYFTRPVGAIRRHNLALAGQRLDQRGGKTFVPRRHDKQICFSEHGIWIGCIAAQRDSVLQFVLADGCFEIRTFRARCPIAMIRSYQPSHESGCRTLSGAPISLWQRCDGCRHYQAATAAPISVERRGQLGCISLLHDWGR